MRHGSLYVNSCKRAVFHVHRLTTGASSPIKTFCHNCVQTRTQAKSSFMVLTGEIEVRCTVLVGWGAELMRVLNWSACILRQGCCALYTCDRVCELAGGFKDLIS